MVPRDSQRAKVYEAEQLVRAVFDRAGEFEHRTVEIHGSRLTLPVERKFASVESVQEYCDRVLRLKWVAAQWERSSTPIRVRARAGTAAAHYEQAGAVLAVPVSTPKPARSTGTGWALRELVVLHEIAHHLDPDPVTEAAHGPRFCGRYIDLVEGVIGPEASLLLRITLHDCGVRVG
ncbi:TIGR04338 family metallohydrolase [Nocardia flavorosea]|uniref:TIGR04338 family metallohydrolase n=1 Tax=Nocardia TaxID=1817 RepID=UPI003A5CE249